VCVRARAAGALSFVSSVDLNSLRVKNVEILVSCQLARGARERTPDEILTSDLRRGGDDSTSEEEDKDNDDFSDDEKDTKTTTTAKGKYMDSDDEFEDDEKRVVKSAKEKRAELLNDHSDTLKGAIDDKDFVTLSESELRVAVTCARCIASAANGANFSKCAVVADVFIVVCLVVDVLLTVNAL
jgi:hypothetical protein